MQTKSIEELASAGNPTGAILVSKKYEGSLCKLKYFCNTHGYFKAYYWSVAKVGCPKCSRESSLKRNLEEVSLSFTEKINSIYNGSLSIIEPYKGCNSRIKVYCNICKREYLVLPQTLLINVVCKKCKNKSRIKNSVSRNTESEYLDLLNSKFGPTIFTTTFTHMTKKTTYKCTKCNTGFVESPNRILRQGCPFCLRFKRLKTKYREYKKKLHEKHPNLKVFFPKSLSKIRFKGRYLSYLHKCLDCEYTWRSSSNAVLFSPGCPNCREKTKYKKYKLYGKTVLVQGYEPVALDLLVKRGYTDILVSSTKEVPKVPFVFEKRKRRHHPDIFIPSKNRLIEVKSPGTMGLLPKLTMFCLTPKQMFLILKKKYRASRKVGYNYIVYLISEKGKRIILPKYWYQYTHKEILLWYKKKLVNL